MNKILSIVLAVAMAVALCSCGNNDTVDTNAKTLTANKANTVEWSIDNNTLLLSGNARMFDYNTYEVENELIPWFFDKADFNSVKISAGVTYVGSFAFYKFENIESVEIAGTVDSLGSSAFSTCDNLKTVVISDGVREIGLGAFGSCKSLEEINIPSTVTKIEKGAFFGCSSLKKLEIPSSVTTFGDDVFTGCTSLTIYCEEGSEAQAQAEKYGLACELLR